MKYPLAIMDYGIGGLGLYKMIRQDHPKLPLLYFSDSGEVPYGKLSKQKLRSRLEKVFRYLTDRGAEHIVVACHSASSVVLASDRNITGLRSQTVRAVVTGKPGSLGIIGGGRTIRSGYYRNELNKRGIRTKQRVAQQLSILIERGEVAGQAVNDAVAEIIKPLSGCDSILLACTHYPVLSHIISSYAPGVKLIDPAEEVYRSIQWLLTSDIQGPTEFLTTGDQQLMIDAAQKAFGVVIPEARRVTF